jgi:hypothetical protein
MEKNDREGSRKRDEEKKKTKRGQGGPRDGGQRKAVL